MTRSSIAPIPPGTLDLTGPAVRRRRTLQRAAMDVLERAGFEEAIPPTFEYDEVFLRAGGAEVAERLIRFGDADGRALALRYDFTAAIARVAATSFADQAPPIKVCYSGKVFRQAVGHSGRPREILQVGAELMGVGGIESDVELVRLTLRLLGALGLADFQINLGHAGILAAGLAALPAEQHAEVRRWIDRKDRATLERHLAGLDSPARDLASLPFVIGRRPTLDATLPIAPLNARPGLGHLIALDEVLTAEERRHVVYDLGEVRGLDYYTGIHFEVFVAGCGRAAGAGGRYDDLMGRFGRPMPALGVALDLDALADVPR
ncbi:MAG: ATP phosphoribosyltransferase regulatory subunit [Gemmatimonadota bacterium]